MRFILIALAIAACSPQVQPATEQQPATTETAAPEPQSNGPAPQTNEERMAQMPSWETARAQGVDFRAVGQEPGWLLDIYQRDKIRLLWDYGDQLADFPLSEPSYPQEGATRYEAQAGGRTLVVTIRRQPCQDGMSGQPYPSTVEVTIDGRSLNGCGRSV